jgi:hypothetical protein
LHEVVLTAQAKCQTLYLGLIQYSFILVLFSLLFGVPPALAAETEADLELLSSSAWNADARLASRLPEDLRMEVDLSSRIGWSTSPAAWSNVEAVGLDMLAVLGSDTRDWLRINLQLYAVRIDAQQSHPFAFDGSGEWKFQPRNSFLDILLLPRGVLTARVGHFELPYGLEAYIDTNGTLRQYTTGRDLGIKTDWGSALTGTHAGIEWIASLSRGSGNEWNGSGDPWLALGRIGMPLDGASSAGLTAAGGDIRVAGKAPPQARWRVAVDGRIEFLSFDLLGELSGGQDDGAGRVAGVVELDWRNRSEVFLGYFQMFPEWRHSTVSAGARLELRSGFLWRVVRGLSLSAEIRQVAAAPDGQPHSTGIFTQIRYRL